MILQSTICITYTFTYTFDQNNHEVPGIEPHHGTNLLWSRTEHVVTVWHDGITIPERETFITEKTYTQSPTGEPGTSSEVMIKYVSDEIIH
jgi:hypothetical protein